MKKLFIIFLFFFIFIFIFSYSNNELDLFKVKAEKLNNEIKKLNEKLKKLNDEYDKIIIKIKKIKEKIYLSKGINKFLQKNILNFYLFYGNKLAYKIDKVKQDLKITKDDYFTYIVLIIDEYNKKIVDSLNKECDIIKLEKINNEKKIWLNLIENYNEILNIDDKFFETKKLKNDLIKKDIKNFYEKRLIQINQILIILEEEEKIRKKLEKAGIDEKNILKEEKIKELKERKLKIEKELKKIQ